MIFWVKFCLVVLLLWVPISLSDHTGNPVPLPEKDYPHEDFLLDKDPSQGWGIRTRNLEKTWEYRNLPYPFLDYPEKNILLNYDAKKQWMLVSNKNSLDFSAESPHGLIPKIEGPFLFFFNPSRSFVKVYQVEQQDISPLFQYFADNLITSYSVSNNHQYIVLGTLSGSLIIFSAKAHFQNPLVIPVNTPHKAIYGVGISDQGTFFTLSSYLPSLLIYGSVKTGKIENSISLSHPVLAQSQKFIQSKHSIFIQEQCSLERFDVKDDSVSLQPLNLTRPYPLVSAQVISEKRLALLYRLTPKEYILDLLNTTNHSLITKIHVSTSSIPIFTSSPHISYILYFYSGGWIL